MSPEQAEHISLRDCPWCGGTRPNCKTCRYIRTRAALPSIMAQVPRRIDENHLWETIRRAASEIAHGYSGDAFTILCDELDRHTDALA